MHQQCAGPDAFVQACTLLTWLADNSVDQLDIAMHKQVGKYKNRRCSGKQLCSISLTPTRAHGGQQPPLLGGHRTAP